jgi:hypothetical protein
MTRARKRPYPDLLQSAFLHYFKISFNIILQSAPYQVLFDPSHAYHMPNPSDIQVCFLICLLWYYLVKGKFLYIFILPPVILSLLCPNFPPPTETLFSNSLRLCSVLNVMTDRVLRPYVITFWNNSWANCNTQRQSDEAVDLSLLALVVSTCGFRFWDTCVYIQVPEQTVFQRAQNKMAQAVVPLASSGSSTCCMPWRSVLITLRDVTVRCEIYVMSLCLSAPRGPFKKRYYHYY